MPTRQLNTYEGRLAVVTGGASGMGRELVRQLAERGCSVAACDLDPQGLDETIELARRVAAKDVALSSHVCDVSDRYAVESFRDGVVAAHATHHVDLLFNNAGVHGEDSFVTGDRATWERVFSVCWNAVYLPSRAFLPLLMVSRSACLVNTSSLNGFFARHGDGAPCTAYSAAKFAVRGFSEALIEDLRTHAPMVRVAVVLPGTVVSGLGTNSDRILGHGPESAAVGGLGGYLGELSIVSADLSEAELHRVGELLRVVFMLPAALAVRQILQAVQEGRWRILVGEDAWDVDDQVRARPDRAYDPHGVSQVNRDLLSGLVSLVARVEAEAIRDLDATFQLNIGRYDLVCQVSGGRVAVERRSGEGAVSASAVSATVASGPETFRRVLSGGEPLARAVDAGRLRIDGDRERFGRLVNALRREPDSVSAGAP
jgi:NAD(P)-dependent dehydrogenase (short-subunit alcohol dehydrogenase family)